MDQAEKLEIFRAQVKNVRALEAMWTHLVRTINRHLRREESTPVQVHTRLLALVYCSWVEALFLRVVHTPYGFSLLEIAEIQFARKSNVVLGWKKCVEVALRKVKGGKGSHLPNVKQTIERLIEEFIEAPSLVRNKLAHGQIEIALNRNNDQVNPVLTAAISDLNVVRLERHKAACAGLSEIIEAIVESPQKGAFKNYWALSERIDRELMRTREYTIEDKVQLLNRKPSLHEAYRP